jgi:hypothetical protein
MLSQPFVLSGDENGLDYKFSQAESSYTFYANFNIQADPDCLINLIYNFDNISNYSSAAESVELIREGDDWYEITFTYRKYLFFKHRSTWRRTLNRQKNKIDFILLSSTDNSGIVPEMVSSSGYYQINSREENCQILYHQTCTLKPGILLNAYMNAGRKAAIDFIYEFKEYIEKNCGYRD